MGHEVAKLRSLAHLPNFYHRTKLTGSSLRSRYIITHCHFAFGTVQKLEKSPTFLTYLLLCPCYFDPKNTFVQLKDGKKEMYRYLALFSTLERFGKPRNEGKVAGIAMHTLRFVLENEAKKIKTQSDFLVKSDFHSKLSGVARIEVTWQILANSLNFPT